MTESEKNGLFERFWQANSQQSYYEKGSGLGLAICKKLIQLMSGDIQVESEKNKGTSFFLLFPTLN